MTKEEQIEYIIKEIKSLEDDYARRIKDIKLRLDILLSKD